MCTTSPPVPHCSADAVQVAYQYDGKKYVGQNADVPGFDTCTECHSTHELDVKMDKCVTCHAGVKTPQDIRISAKDYDGNKDVEEGIAAEVASIEAKLYDAIKAYSKEITKTSIVYSPTAYPYFFRDTNGDGKADEKEAVSANCLDRLDAAPAAGLPTTTRYRSEGSWRLRAQPKVRHPDPLRCAGRSGQEGEGGSDRPHQA